MKQLVFLLSAFLAAFINLQAQDLDFGAKGGLNRSEVIGDFREGYKSRLSFHLGVFAEMPLKGRFSFHPELLYSSQGFTYV